MCVLSLRIANYFYCMNKFQIITAFLFSLVLIGCNNGESSTEVPGPEKQFYPISSYIESQLKYLDSVPLAIIHYTTINNATDTGITEKKDFRTSVGKAFIESDISGADQKKNYEETSFIDATLGVITLSYAPKRDGLPIQKAYVLLSQENSAVKTIYVERTMQGGDSTVTKKMLWNANKSCQVTSIIQKTNQPEKTIQERFVWDELY